LLTRSGQYGPDCMEPGVQYRIDEDEAVLHIDLDSSDPALRFVDQLQAILQHRPDVRSWDWIIEARVLPSDLGVDHVAHLAEAYRASEAGAVAAQAVVALVSDDQNLFLWAQVMDFQFPGRRHLVVNDLEAARNLIARERAART